MRTKAAATTDLRTIATLCRILGGANAPDATEAIPPAAGDMLAIAELLCEAVVDDGATALLVLSREGRILFANDAFAGLLGQDAGALHGAPIDALLHPAQADAAASLLDDARGAPALPVSGDFRIRLVDGSWQWIRLVVRASPLSPAGNVLCGVLDISGGAPLSRAAVRSGSHALVSIDSALDAIVSMDADGLICAFNSAAERMFGMPRARAIGRTVAETLIRQDDRSAHRRGLHRHLATGESGMFDRRMELTALHADGHEFPVEMTLTWSGDGAGRRYTAFIRDISERRRLVADLRAAAGRLAAVVQAQQQLAASDAGPQELIDRIAALAAELLDGRMAALEPLFGDVAPGDAQSSDTRVRRHRFSEAEVHVEWPLDRAEARDFGDNSLAVAPLHAGDRVLGHIKVLARRGQRYTDADAHALELFAGSLGAVIQQRQAASTQAGIIAIQREVSVSDLSLQGLMALICERAHALLGGDAALIEWIDGQELLYVAASGSGLDYIGLRVQIDASLSGLCARSGEATLTADAGIDPRADRALARRAGVRAMVLAPLRAGDTLFGVLKVTSRRPGVFADSDVHHLQVLGESMGAMIQRRRDAERVAESEAQYRLLFDSNPHPMWVSDVETLRFLAVNAAALAKNGYTEEEFLAMSILDYRVDDHIDFSTMPRSVKGLLGRHRCRDGTLIDTEVSWEQIDFRGRQARLVMGLDITQRVRAEAAEVRSTRALRLVSACNAALVRIDDEQELLETICRMFIDIGGYRLAGIGYAAVPGDASRLTPMAAASEVPEHAVRVLDAWDEITFGEECPASRAVLGNQPAAFADLRTCASHAWCRVALSCGFGSAIALPLRSDGVAFGFLSMYAEQPVAIGEHELTLLQELADNTAFGIGAIRVETERRQFLSELAYGASHDAVTGLERYALLERRLAELVARPGQFTSVALFDIDRFNSINETLGHDAADDILRRVGERLMAFADDRVSVAHLASDEFVVVMADTLPEAAGFLTERMRAAVARTIDAPGFSVLLTATVGISYSPAHGSDARELVRRAQAAMEGGKRAGRDCSHAFLTEQMQDLEDRALLGARLRLALDRGEMRLHYQPQYGAAGGQLIGFEALLRWHSPDLGAVSPARFIPIAETLGLMPVLGAWVLREACRQARAWLDDGHRSFRVAVNVSGQQLMRPGLVRVVADALADFAIPPHVLDLEITESSLMENVSLVQGTLADLKALGVTLSLDDFGTGYSSLAYLKHFSLDKLKIDRSFVRGLPDNADDAAIARTIVSMGHQLRLLVSAEGVETREQAEFLRGIGCDELQGYHFGHPAAAADAARLFLDR